MDDYQKYNYPFACGKGVCLHERAEGNAGPGDYHMDECTPTRSRLR
jgi:hypothetical protein